MQKRQFSPNRLSLYPKPVVVVTSINNLSEIGAATIAWNGIVSSRPQVISVSFLPDSFTRKCIFESREFVINVPDGSLWKEVNFLGSVSGAWDNKLRSYPPAFQSLSLSPSTLIRAPRVNEFYLNLECRMLRSVQIGLYDCIFGEVLTMHCDASLFVADHPKGNIDFKSVQPLVCLGDQYWTGGRFLGISTENKIHPHGSEH
ncbi:MAG: hypothetical protein QOD75_972 [Blastocatellia bacterium]|jgi:flavin reductase (DIM6/NTAB) family NADH-FMN oxidoreductase RutF|nr:hypothetical protein [Blastocatellia bacterium]